MTDDDRKLIDALLARFLTRRIVTRTETAKACGDLSAVEYVAYQSGAAEDIRWLLKQAVRTLADGAENGNAVRPRQASCDACDAVRQAKRLLWIDG